MLNDIKIYKPWSLSLVSSNNSGDSWPLQLLNQGISRGIIKPPGFFAAAPHRATVAKMRFDDTFIDMAKEFPGVAAP